MPLPAIERRHLGGRKFSGRTCVKGKLHGLAAMIGMPAFLIAAVALHRSLRRHSAVSSHAVSVATVALVAAVVVFAVPMAAMCDSAPADPSVRIGGPSLVLPVKREEVRPAHHLPEGTHRRERAHQAHGPSRLAEVRTRDGSRPRQRPRRRHAPQRPLKRSASPMTRFGTTKAGHRRVDLHAEARKAYCTRPSDSDLGIGQLRRGTCPLSARRSGSTPRPLRGRPKRAHPRRRSPSTDARRHPTASPSGLGGAVAGRLSAVVPHHGPPAPPDVTPVVVSGMALAVQPGGGSPTSSQRVT